MKAEPLAKILKIVKVIHFIEYAVLGFLMTYSLKKSGVRRYVLVGWILASVYGIADKIHQSFVPMRDASVFDVFADGMVLGLSQIVGRIDIKVASHSQIVGKVKETKNSSLSEL